MKTGIFATLFLFLLCGLASPEFMTGPEQLATQGAAFTWEEARAKTVRVLLESKKADGATVRAPLGSGFLISADGLFVTAYHVMQYCLESERRESGFASSVECSTTLPGVSYKAQVGEQIYDIEVLSFGKKKESVNGKNSQTPDETIKHKDFVIAKIKAEKNPRFAYWKLADFSPGAINLANAQADFELQPLRPPKRVFIAGYPERGFVITQGFLNLTEDHRRGYFATDLELYSPGYLKSHGISPDTKWGIRVENHMSGGPVIDSAGYVVGIVVSGANLTTGVLSIENVLETFFSRTEPANGREGVLLDPTQTPLYLKSTTAS
ncbi:MAG TPA: serine protease [Candidatus Binatia bacterium]|jgi:hypothetical protein